MHGYRSTQPNIDQVHSSFPGLTAWCTGLFLGVACIRAAADDLNVQVQQIKPKQGTVVVALYNKAADFPVPQKRLAVQVIEAQGDTAAATFHDLAAGRYAVVAYQDENRNGQLDKNFLGIPTEPYGFSNDARGSMGPPSFDAAAVNSATTPNVVINLH